jgi:hypothetical protein
MDTGRAGVVMVYGGDLHNHNRVITVLILPRCDMRVRGGTGLTVLCGNGTDGTSGEGVPTVIRSVRNMEGSQTEIRRAKV